VEATVVHVSEQDRKIDLSMRKIEEEARRDEEGIREVRTRLGDLIKEQMRGTDH
jgi:hypothetical protein